MRLAAWLALFAVSGCGIVSGIDDLRLDDDAVGSDAGGGAVGGQGSGGKPCDGSGGECTCTAGYEPAADGLSCVDIDECATATHNCDAVAACRNEAGSFACECPAGYGGDGTSCALYASCGALVVQSLPSGLYPIDPDGPGGADPFEVYCDQESEGGGWTLIMKLSSHIAGFPSATFGYDAIYWSTSATLNVTDNLPNGLGSAFAEAKYQSFNAVLGTTMRLEWVDPALAFDFPLAGTTALDMFSNSGEVQLAGSESDVDCNGAALSSAAGYGYDPAYQYHARARQFFGLNGGDVGDNGLSLLRFGFGSNDEPFNSWLPLQGVGAYQDNNTSPNEPRSLLWVSASDCNDCSCYGTPYDPIQTAANLWVR